MNKKSCLTHQQNFILEKFMKKFDEYIIQEYWPYIREDFKEHLMYIIYDEDATHECEIEKLFDEYLQEKNY